MNFLTILGGGLFFVATSVVGVRLLFLWRRDGGVPELILGLAFLVGGTIGGSLSPYALSAAQSHPPRVAGMIVLVSSVLGVVGMGLYNAFTWRVFRPSARWASLLVVSILLSGLGVVVWFAATGVYTTGVQPPMQRSIMNAASGIGPVWATIEGFRYWRMMRRRVVLGIGDPVVANRFLLWAVGGACATLIVFGGLPTVFLDPSHSIVEGYLLLLGVFGTIASVAYGLAFFPPLRYLAWVNSGAARA